MTSLLGFCFANSCAAQIPTLKELLEQNAIPTESFSPMELGRHVDGGGGAKDDVSLVAYMVRQGDGYTGDLQIARYDSAAQKVERKAIHFEEDDLCGGSPLGIQFLGKFAWLPLHFNPSANCLLALDDQLTVQAKVFGFEITEVAPGQVVFTEGMMHFAPVHDERLQLVNLATHTALELYPPDHDPLRAPFETEHAKRMPPQKICEVNQDDFCDASKFDEAVGLVHVLQNGGFTFLASWDASHVTKPDGDSETVVSETNQYVYRFQSGKWLFCDVKVSDSAQSEKLERSIGLGSLPCTPRIPVTPDMSSADLSPFPPPEFPSIQKEQGHDLKGSRPQK